jgi:hypothetical protein
MRDQRWKQKAAARCGIVGRLGNQGRGKQKQEEQKRNRSHAITSGVFVFIREHIRIVDPIFRDVETRAEVSFEPSVLDAGIEAPAQLFDILDFVACRKIVHIIAVEAELYVFRRIGVRLGDVFLFGLFHCRLPRINQKAV